MSKIIKITYRLIPVIVIRHHIRLMAVTKITRKFETCPPLTIRIMSFKRHDAMLLGVITFQNETDPNQRGHRDLSVWSDSRSMVVVSLFRVFDVFHSVFNVYGNTSNTQVYSSENIPCRLLSRHVILFMYVPLTKYCISLQYISLIYR